MPGLSAYICLRACVCVPAPRLLITSGVAYDWSNKFYDLYMAAVVDIDSGCGIGIHMRCEK